MPASSNVTKCSRRAKKHFLLSSSVRIPFSRKDQLYLSSSKARVSRLSEYSSGVGVPYADSSRWPCTSMDSIKAQDPVRAGRR